MSEQIQDGIERIEGGAVYIANGIKYRVPELDRARDMPAITEYYASKIRSLGGTLEKIYTEVKNPVLQEQLIKTAIQMATPTEAEILGWMQTYEGEVFVTWFQMIKTPGQEKITPQEAKAIINTAAMAQAKIEAKRRGLLPMPNGKPDGMTDAERLMAMRRAGVTDEQIAAIARDCAAKQVITDAERMEIVQRHGVTVEQLVAVKQG